ncbi:hypothetical protein [Maricaulis sp. MIT060901]|uniref:hypothetical protein n=1 Tax=Maricaulis sp. MIT060901 TaxID=3096993 RepID=UPI00399B6F93
MSIEVNALEMRGVALVKVVGEIARTDLGAALIVMEKRVDSGDLRGLVVDAREVELHERKALGLEMWEDALSALPPGFPVAYIAPPGFEEKRAEGVAETAREWASNLKLFETVERGENWVSAQLARRSMLAG